MRTRVLLPLVLLALTAGSAHAAPACNLLRPTDDGSPGGPAWQESVVPGSTAAFRLKSGDVAASTRALTAVFRLHGGTTTDPTAAQQGRVFSLGFSATPDDHYVLEAHDGGAQRFSLYHHTLPWYAPDQSPPNGVYAEDVTFVGNVSGVFDAMRNEVRITAPLKVFGGKVKRGTVLRNLGASVATTYGEVPPGGPVRNDFYVGPQRDALHGYRATYTVGGASCVRV